MGVGLRIAQVVDGDDFNIVLFATFVMCTQDVASDAAIAVNCDTNSHVNISLGIKVFRNFMDLQNLFDGCSDFLGCQSKIFKQYARGGRLTVGVDANDQAI